MEEGVYPLEGNMFIAGGRKYVIRERKEKKAFNPKPKHYLIMLSPFQYVSSLFPIASSEGYFHFDFKQELFQLRVREAEVELKKIEPVQLE